MSAGNDWVLQWRDQLRNGLAAMRIVLGDEQQDKLLGYLGLLCKWNRAFNLTAVREPQEMVARQLLDSLSVLDLLRKPTLLDVGTGPGLPGIPLAIARPDMAFTLLDSNGKKTRFLRQVKMQLELQNVQVVRNRIELFQSPGGFQIVTSRAFSSLLQFHALAARLVAENGRLLAMKGSVAVEELDELRKHCAAVSVVALQVPETVGERNAVVVRP